MNKSILSVGKQMRIEIMMQSEVKHTYKANITHPFICMSGIFFQKRKNRKEDYMRRESSEREEPG